MALEALEKRLAADLGRAHCIATGRGATAIWLALEAIGELTPKRKVVLPATLCTSPVAVTVLAGFEPVFCDVDPLTGNLDPGALAALLTREVGIACVLAAHLYGQPCAIRAIAALCTDHGVFLIEDAAQAFGADIGGVPAGGFGDLSIVSFGHTKILDVGGGGAVLTDNEGLARRLRALAASLPDPPETLGDWAAEYRAEYYRLIPKVKSGELDADLIGQLCLRHPSLYRYRLETGSADKVLNALGSLPAERDHRRAMAAIYAAELAECGADLMAEEPGGVPWRFNLLIPDGHRDAVADALRAAGHDASPWYPAVAPFFTASADRNAFPGAGRIENEILNLWVDHSVNEARIRSACAVIRDALSGART